MAEPRWRDDSLSSSFAANVVCVSSRPAETEAWILQKVNRLRKAGAPNLPALTAAELDAQILGAINSEFAALEQPAVSLEDPDVQLSMRAGFMTLLSRVFGLSYLTDPLPRDS